MGSLSIWHWLLVLGVGVLLFGGKGKISSVMGDFAKGIKAFKSGMKEPDEETATNPPAQVTPPGAATSTAGAAASPAHVGVGGAAAPVGVGGGGGAGDRPRDHA